jgi:hypothetical protein
MSLTRQLGRERENLILLLIMRSVLWRDVDEVLDEVEQRATIGGWSRLETSASSCFISTPSSSATLLYSPLRSWIENARLALTNRHNLVIRIMHGKPIWPGIEDLLLHEERRAAVSCVLWEDPGEGSAQ